MLEAAEADATLDSMIDAGYSTLVGCLAPARQRRADESGLDDQWLTAGRVRPLAAL
jgi:hypothetical protein